MGEMREPVGGMCLCFGYGKLWVMVNYVRETKWYVTVVGYDRHCVRDTGGYVTDNGKESPWMACDCG